jgi:hypothetical protein
LEAANGAFIACNPALVGGAIALTFQLQGRTIAYDENRIGIIINAITHYSQQNCTGLVGIHDNVGGGILNAYGLSVDGDVYISDGTSPISWPRVSKVVNASGGYVCSNTNIGNPGTFYDAVLILDHAEFPTPYTITPDAP